MKLAWGSLRAGSMGVQLPPWDDSWYANRGYQTAAGLRVAPESAMRLAAVFACVRVVSETIGSLPLIIYRRMPDGGKERATDHPLYDLLHNSPNQWQTAMEFTEMMQAHLELRGNAYAQIVSGLGPNGTGSGLAVDSLVPIHPDRVVVKRLPNGRLQYQVRDMFGGGIQTYAMEEMLHLRGMSADGLVGMSTISVAAEVIGNALASQEYSSRFFENDATPPVAFTHQKTLSAEAHTRLKTSLNEAHGGANHHKPIILEEGMTVTALGVKPDDAQLLDSRQYSRGDIASIFRVPPHKIGDLTKATFSNIEEQNIEFATDCIRPRLVRMEQRINFCLIDPLGYRAASGDLYFCEFLMEAILRGDQESRYDAYAIGRQWGWLSANDIRTLESMNPIGPEGDVYLSPLNMEDVATADPDKSDEGQEEEDDTAEGGGTGALRLQEFVRAAADRVVRKEVKALRKAETKPKQFAKDVRAFYETHAAYVAEQMHIAIDVAERYVAENLDVVLNRVNGIDRIADLAPARLVELALPDAKKAKAQKISSVR
jgi:HK97 family phage portal protein